ncbi:MAG: hypothetical protein JWM98_3236, partial [Thermoleophilia bacterium]|nr:hypothetical protein [Thermoleophilia bacterium]
MAVPKTTSATSAATSHAGHAPAGGSGGGAAPVGEGSKPKTQAEASARNVGATPSASGTGAAQGARDGAGTKPAVDAPMAGHDHAGGTAAAGHGEPIPAGTPNVKQGSTGPVVPKGQAPTLTIPDGAGFGGVKGRQQNDGDKQQNNYSVTDANFNPHLGLMDKDPDTGQPMTYVKDIQTYNAAGYINAFAPATAAKLEKAQGDGAGMILEGSSYLMGLTRTEPAYLKQYGIDGADIPAKIPGSDRDAREYVKSAQDATGQDWARMHHPESAWDMYKGLTGIGVDGETALSLSGDDGVSGAGRLNGQNNQDGGNGFNAGEVEVWKQAAQLQQRTGLPVVQTMMAGHDHGALDPSALTDPAVNSRLGITGTGATAERANAITAGLLSGRLDEGNGGGGNGGGADNAGGGGGG